MLTAEWQQVKDGLARLGLEIAESALLSCLEPNPIGGCYEDELPAVRKAIRTARGGRPARFTPPVNRNAFLLGCLDYTENRPEEHLLVGFGFRHGSTTKVETVHHAVGGSGSVSVPVSVAHTMWDHYRQDEANELLIFHNHPLNPLNTLFDNLPLVSMTDRVTLAAQAMNLPHLIRELLEQGRILFYVGENGFVRQYRLPSLLTLLGR